jgi:hypothetical protein
MEQKLRRRLKEDSSEFQSELKKLQAAREERKRSRIARDEERRRSRVDEPIPVRESALLVQSVDNPVSMTVEGKRPNYLFITDSVSKDFSIAVNSHSFRGRWEQSREVMHSATSFENDFYSGAYFFEAIHCNLFHVMIQNLSIVYGTGKGCLQDSFLSSVRDCFGLPEEFSFAAVFVLAGKEDIVRVCDPVFRSQMDTTFPELTVVNLPHFTFHNFYLTLLEGLTMLRKEFDCPLFYLGLGPMPDATPTVEPVWIERMSSYRVDSNTAEDLHYFCSRVIAGNAVLAGDLPVIELPILCPLPRYSEAVFQNGCSLSPRAIFMIIRDIHNCFARAVNLLQHFRSKLDLCCCIGVPALKSPDSSISRAVEPFAPHNHGGQLCFGSTVGSLSFFQDIGNHLTIQVCN